MSMTATAPAQTPLTWEAYLREGEVNRRYDIIDGIRIFTMAAPTLAHQEIVGNVYEALRAYQRSNGRGRTVQAPFDVVIEREPLRTRQPDLLFISHERLEQAGGIHLASPLTVPPELTVEVLSPSDTRRTRLAKLEDYVRIGVSECWLVSPEAETVEVLRLSSGGMESVSLVGIGGSVRSLCLPELAVPVAQVFAV